MKLNEYGQIAFDEWVKTPENRPNVELGEFNIMPNHLHGIIRIMRRGELHSPENADKLNSINEMCDLNTPSKTGVCNAPQSPSQTIGAIVRGYKSTVTKQFLLLGFDNNLWQRNYYERIIRDENAYRAISNYIINNPVKWCNDKFYEG